MADKASLMEEIMAMSNLGGAGDVRGLRGVIQATEGREPGYWQTTAGRLIRSAANQGALHGKLDLLRYLCGERGVPSLADNPDEYALSDCLGMHQQESMWGWRPLELAAIFGAKEVTMYLLSLTGPEDDLGRTWLDGDGLLHYAAYAGDLLLLEPLVQRGVDFNLGNDSGLRTIQGAIRFCRLSVVRFLIAQYQKRLKGRNALRELQATQPIDESGNPHPVVFGNPHPVVFYAIRQSIFPLRESPAFDISDEERRAMVVLLVQEAGADICHEDPDELRSIYGGGNVKGHVTTRHENLGHTFLPVHMAAFEGVKPIMEFFLSDCGMPVNTPTSDLRLTVLHCLSLSWRDEKYALPIVIWLIQEKGADVTCRDTKGYTAAELARIKGKARLYHYLQTQEDIQAVWKGSQNKEIEKAAAAVEMATRIEAAEEAMAELFLELEAEEEAVAATGSKKKDGKASAGKKTKTKKK